MGEVRVSADSVNLAAQRPPERKHDTALYSSSRLTEERESSLNL